MFEIGIIDETKKIINQYGSNLPLLETIGYKEAKDVIKENLKLEKAIEITTTKTIQFAKRQKTWFRNKNNPIWLNNKNLLKDAICLLYTSPSPRDLSTSRMPSSA